MAKQQLSTEQTQKQHLALEQQRMLGLLLEKNGDEMTEHIEIKLDENPALEIKKEGEDDNGLDNGQQQNNSDDNHDVRQDVTESNGDDDAAAWYKFFANNRSRDDEWYEPTAVSEKTLHEFLEDQLGELELDDTQQAIAKAIVGNIEDNGYLWRTNAEIADDLTFNEGIMVDAEQVQQVLEIVQSLDPAGIAAHNLRECMLLQLRRKPQNEDTALAITIIDKYLKELADRNFDFLSRRLGVDRTRLEEVFKHQIRRGINPLPGNAFGSSHDIGQQITPDFEIEYDEDNGHLTVTLPNKIPALQISETYVMMNERYKSKQPLSVLEQKEKKTIIDAYQRANLFIEVLKQRQETLFKTMSAIVQCQFEYFMSGNNRDLKPLGQKKIAEMIGKDVTVVSRAISNKYVQLPWGIKSLKSFFSEDVNGGSRHEVLDDLQQLVDNEDKTHPLSDEALCNRLVEMGHTLRRRTVAKYRDQLRIPSSTERRRMSR